MPEKILAAYGICHSDIIPFGKGLINNTWKVITPGQNYILQKINSGVFKCPDLIARNIQLLGEFLKKNEPDYFFVAPIKTINNQEMLYQPGDGYFRLFPFVNDSCTFDVADTPQHAYEAAKQFGRFTRLLSAIPANQLKTTIDEFHDLGYRYRQFMTAVKNGNRLRIDETKSIIDFIIDNNDIVSTYEKIKASNEFKLRPTHHDTKISNVLFNKNGTAICVIDLDTVMPGYFISDVGDMMRTYLSASSEEEKEFEKIESRDEYFIAIVNGYLSEMATKLSSEETDSFVYSGIFMTYMQAIRFLTDYLNNDVYYGAKYEKHNYVRAMNQVTLLQQLLKKEKKYNDLVKETLELVR